MKEIINKERVEIASNYNDNGVLLNIRIKNKNIKFPLFMHATKIKRIKDINIVNRLQKLEEIWLDDYLEEKSNGYLLKYEDIYNLSNDQKSSIKIPYEAIDYLYIKSESIISSKNYKVNYDIFVDKKNIGNMYELNGNILSVFDKEYLLREDEYSSVKLIKNDDYYKNITSKAILINKLKLFAERTSIKIDDYLERNDYIVPDGLEIEIEDQSEKDEIKLKPNYKNIKGIFEKEIQKNDLSSRNFSAGEGTNRKRMLLSDNNLEEIKNINNIPLIKDEEIPKFIENPISFLPPNISIDVNDFSERVKGLKKYVYRSYPVIKKSDNKIDWFDFEIEGKIETVDGEKSESIEYDDYKDIIKKGIDENKEYVKYKDGWIKIDEQDKKLNKSFKNFDEGINKNIKLTLDIFDNVNKLEYSEEFEKFAKIHNTAEVKIIKTPEIFNAKLYPYQEVGYSWLCKEDNLNGYLLADDMGLGKTIQVISFLAKKYEDKQLKPSLIVLPVSLITNWNNEINKFVDIQFDMYVHRGSNRIKNKEFIRNKDIVFTSYETLRSDQVLFGQIKFKNIILDEAQKIKNPSAITTNACKAMNADIKISLTGTPVENNLSELWSIIDFICPGYMGSMSSFRKNYQLPIENNFSEREIEALIEKIKPIFLRRNKTEVLKGLPQKHEKKIFVNLTEEQENIYNNILSLAKQSKKDILKYLQQLIQISSHSSLIKEYDNNNDKLYEGSEKLKKTIDILKTIKSKKEKVLIFTRYKKMQEILTRKIYEEFKISASKINGDTSANRTILVDRFNNSKGFNAMILSPKAAGIGLNITGANHVIHYTREWNPAIENQANDRVHRIGQNREVYIYYPITKSDKRVTIEEKMDMLLQEKRRLFSKTIIPVEKIKISKDELAEVFE